MRVDVIQTDYSRLEIGLQRSTYLLGEETVHLHFAVVFAAEILAAGDLAALAGSGYAVVLCHIL
jgi:hypothetical protein